MSDLKDLETIYLALEEGEVLRDMGDDWSTEDTKEFGVDFGQLLELREFILAQDYSKNLGFAELLNSLFPKSCRDMLTDEEREIWGSIETSLDPITFGLAMSCLLAGDFGTIRDSIINDFLLEELADVEAAKDIKKMILDNFKSWKSSDQAESLMKKLPKLAALELDKLRYLRG
jgi:hypothetical protein